jgi:hypothetical protein
VATCVGGARLFGDLNDSSSTVSIALRNATSIKTLPAVGVDTSPNIYYINDTIDEQKLAITAPQIPPADTFYQKIVIPGVIAAVGAMFFGQAIAFAKQLRKGESEFDE